MKYVTEAKKRNAVILTKFSSAVENVECLLRFNLPREHKEIVDALQMVLKANED